MNSKQYRQADRSCIWHPYTKFSSINREDFPVIIRGKGIYLYDTDGNRWLDAISSWWACALGHNHPRIVSAINKQAKKLQHSILGNLSHPPAIELASELVKLFPNRKRRVLFASDGASAVEAALKISLQYWHNIGRPEKNKFVSLENAYHGDTLGAVSVGKLEQFHKQYDPLLFPVFRAESPCCGTCIHGKKPETCKVECFTSMEKIFQKHSSKLAAVIVEPLCQCAAGMRIYSPRYLQKLASLCKKYNVLLIADEIAVGYGRTGKMFAFEHAQIDPDIVCIGKAMSAGYLPISATVVKEKIFKTFSDTPDDHTFYHGHTFAGNPIACAAALETLKVYKDENIVARVAVTSKLLAKKMSKLRDLPNVLDVRCLGMIGAVELGGSKGIQIALYIRKEMLKSKILVRPLGNVIYLMLPLVTPKKIVSSTVSLLRKILEEKAYIT
ncbi:MAG: adenosylmethionine--8-amino-7-oxononanoate transaminase [Kiritimatiellae bacterium]|nr:adenosylmethionine--8-amino-7-oxononanoate transaminase [Kiritimatiellia bacterium]MDD5519374.1 adenosylmethionine--8-amino-7-oxononanoate transaminase [Kiritimatiellia bacterium]